MRRMFPIPRLPAPAPTGTPRLALLQLTAGADKAANLAAAREAIAAAARGGANLVALPECFNSPYATDQFPKYAEPVPSRRADVDAGAHPSTAMLSAAAAEHGIFLVGGACAAMRRSRVSFLRRRAAERARLARNI